MSDEIVHVVRMMIEWASLGIEVLAVAVVVTAVVTMAVRRGTVRFLFKLDHQHAYASYKRQLGEPLLLGLELLVAADVIRMVAIHPGVNQ